MKKDNFSLETEEDWNREGFDIDKCGCNDCSPNWRDNCPYAWDFYNQDTVAGIDCLASK